MSSIFGGLKLGQAAPRYARSWREAVPTGRSAARQAARGAALSIIGRVPRFWDRSPMVRCIYCHHVFEDQAEAFAAILDALGRDGRFIDTATLLDLAERRRPLDGRYYHLSFDDGFKNNLEVAAPLLLARGIPAVFFVPTGLVGADWSAARRYTMQVTRYRAPVEVMSWADLERLRAQGFEIGSHTRTHARLSALAGAAALEDEIAGSREDLVRRLGACELISWPFGGRADVDDVAIGAVARAGYRACFGAFRGRVIPGETDVLRIPRHHFEAQWPVSHVKLFATGFGEG